MTSTSIPVVECEHSSFICSVAFLPDEKGIVGGGCDCQVRRWRMEDGQEVGPPMDTGAAVLSLAVTRDGQWVVSGMDNGEVVIWNAETHSKLNAFQPHPGFPIEVVDVSPDGTRIATGSHDSTACVWSFSIGERLLGPLKHDDTLAAVKYSLDGRLLATATCEIQSVRIYNSQDGHLLVNSPVQVDSFNQSLSWSRNSRHLFALSDSNIKCLDVSTGAVLSEWPIHSRNDPKGIILANNERFIAAAANSSVSFWDTATQGQVGPIIEHADVLLSMTVSSNYDFVISGVKSIILQSLRDVLPSPYCDNIPNEPETSSITEESTTLEETVKTLLADVRDLRAQHEFSQSKIAVLENTVKELRIELAESQRRADQDKNILSVAVESFRAELASTGRESDMKIARLKTSVRGLHTMLDDSHHKPVQRMTP